MIYIRIFHFLLGCGSYNYHNYVNNLAAHHLLQEEQDIFLFIDCKRSS